VVDLGRFAEISGGDAEFEREIAGEYCVQARQLIEEIAATILVGDAHRLRRAAHTLKGSSHTIGADAVARLAAELEHAAVCPTPEPPDDWSVRLEAALLATEHALELRLGPGHERGAA
jgi:HPt (histidine-containing phosphotransfer) domain-containing protein